MRTNIEIDDALIKSVMKSTGAKTKREAVDSSLRLAKRLQDQTAIRRWKGKIRSEGNLEESRLGRCVE